MNRDIDQLLKIMQQLRDPVTGCPWDLEQNYASIVPHTLEEAYEVAETIEQHDLESLPGELGDLLFQIIFYAQLGAEEGRFNFFDVVTEISDKLIRRHPHVFANEVVSNTNEQTRLWEQIKQQEKGRKTSHQSSLLSGVLTTLPALTRAAKIQRKAAHIGFDWSESSEVLDKVEEELAELRHENTQQPPKPEHIEEELGDLLFSIVNLGRHLKIDSEGALRRATRKFEQRFQNMEQLCEQDGQSLETLSAEEMEQRWQQVKQKEER